MEGTERKTERFPVMFERTLLSEIDDFLFENRIRTRAEAVRFLIRRGLESVNTNEKGSVSA